MSKLFSLVIIFFFFVFTKSSRAEEISPFILGGSDSKVGEFPFIVSLQFISGETWLHYCAGTILSDFWILTAAMCTFEDDPTQNRAQYGVNEISSNQEAPNVAYFDRLLWHEDFHLNSLFNDIGLIKTQSKMEVDLFDYKVKLPIASAYFSTGTPAVVAGFGRNGTDLPMSPILQRASYQIYNREDCATLHGGDGSINHNNICAGQLGTSIGQCNGDSGGPLLVDRIQIGIISWKPKPCEDSTRPGVFTAIAPFINWIKTHAEVNMKLQMFMRVEN